MVYGSGRYQLHKKYGYIFNLFWGISLWACSVMLLVSFFDDGGFSGMENEPLSEKLLMAFCLILLLLLSIAFLVSGVEGLVKRIKIKKGILDEKEEQLKEQKKIEELDRKLSDINLFSEVSIAVSVLSLFYTDKYPVTKEIRRKKLPKSIRKILTTFLFYAFFICLGLFWDVNGRPGNHNNYFIIGIGLIISILVTWLTLKFDKTGKKTVALGMSAEDFCYHAVKYHNVYLKMIEKNGYTSHTIEKADSAIESYREGANISILYLKNYILLPAEYSMIKGYYNRALDYLNVINPEMLLNPDLLVEDKGFSYFAYYALKMELCAWLKDRNLAEKTMEEIKPRLIKEYKGEFLKYIVYTIYFEYYMVMGEYSSAKEYANKLLLYKDINNEILFSAYVSNAQVDIAFGEYEEAQMFMDEARKVACEGEPTMKQSYNSLINKLDVTGKYIKL